MDGQMLMSDVNSEALQDEAVPQAGVDQFASLGSATGSLMSGGEEDGSGTQLMPSVVDIKRLQKLKADQEQRLKSLCTRVDRLTSQEQRVWNDVALTQQRSLQAQEKQWQRQAQEAQRLRMQREVIMQEQVLRDRACEMRLHNLEMKDVPRLMKFEDNRASSRQVREDADRNARYVRTRHEQEVQAKAMLVEKRRQQRRALQLKRELVLNRQEQARSDANMSRYSELQEEIQNAELAIAVAEREELSAVHRLQNSQNVRSEVLTQLTDIQRRQPRSPREMSPERGDEDAQPRATSSPQPVRTGFASARSSRSSPRLGGPGGGGGVRTSSPPQSSRGRLPGSRSTPGLVATSGSRTDLGQITEEGNYGAHPVQKTLSGPRTRALQMQRAKQSPVRPVSANAGARAR